MLLPFFRLKFLLPYRIFAAQMRNFYAVIHATDSGGTVERVFYRELLFKQLRKSSPSCLEPKIQ